MDIPLDASPDLEELLPTRDRPDTPKALRVVSLFSGIGGLDLGLQQAGMTTVAMCEVWEPARRVLAHRFPQVPIHLDVRHFEPTVEYDVLAAGFPCTDISHAGTKRGIFGPASGLVSHVFRIAGATSPPWVVLENVPNLLSLHGGAGIRYITGQLERIGYRWAYRTVDPRSLGLPQRRPRVIILASRTHDPATCLLSGSSTPRTPPEQHGPQAWGFYWTEGRNGTGLVPNAVPPLKGGSTIGLPSTPAIWFPLAPRGRQIVVPSIEDGEALQGLPRGWTSPSLLDGKPDNRWKMIGNAVPVPLAKWVGTKIVSSSAAHAASSASTSGTITPDSPLPSSGPWPSAGYGGQHGAWSSLTTTIPITAAPLENFVLPASATPLSHRATAGFLSRLEESGRARSDDAFYLTLEEHLHATRPALKRQNQRFTSGEDRPGAIEAHIRRMLHSHNIAFRLESRPVRSLTVRAAICIPSHHTCINFLACVRDGCPEHGTNAERTVRIAARRRGTRARDRAILTQAGWVVLDIWGHDTPETAWNNLQQTLLTQTK